MSLRLAIEKLGRSFEFIKPFLKLNYGEQSRMFSWNILKSSLKNFRNNFLRIFCLNFPQGFPQAVWRFSRQPKHISFFFVGLCIFALATPRIEPVSAQSTQAIVQEILDGNQVFIQNQQASVNDVARAQQQVRTGNSRTALLFNTGAVARLSANSVLRIGQCAQLSRGTILVNGAINACSSGITTGVRGTTYLLEVDDSGNQQVKVLEGEVTVKRNAQTLKEEDDQPTNNKPIDKPTNTKLPSPTPITQTSAIPQNSAPKSKQFPIPSSDPRLSLPLNNASESGSENKKPVSPIPVSPKPPQQPDEVVLKSGEKIEVDQGGALGVIQKLTENEFVGLLQGALFQGFANQIPGLNKVRDVFNGLFPGGNFPISIPSIPTPSIPIPSLPRLPF